jgi:hypothetical protein
LIALRRNSILYTQLFLYLFPGYEVMVRHSLVEISDIFELFEFLEKSFVQYDRQHDLGSLTICVDDVTDRRLGVAGRRFSVRLGSHILHITDLSLVDQLCGNAAERGVFECV